MASLPWGSRKQISLTDKQNYQLWVPDITYGDNIYSSNIPETKALNFTASADKPKEVSLQFQTNLISTVSVNLDIKGLPQSSSTIQIGLTSTNKTYNFTNLNNGTHPISIQPGTYSLSASLYTLQGKSYTALLNNPYSLADGNTINISYSEVKNALLMPFKDMTFNINRSVTPIVSNLQEIADNSKNYSYVMAFITQNQWDSNHCYSAWGGQPSMALKDKLYQKEIQYLHSKKGIISVSFGGENGVAIETKCTQAELVQTYQSAFDIYGAAFIDFDIEGGALGDVTANTNRFNALKELQSKNNKVKVSLTLPDFGLLI